MNWFRFYHASYRNPKIQDMRPELFKFWINFLCVASESDTRGIIPSEAHLRRALGLSKATVKRYCRELEGMVLLHRSDGGELFPHDWEDLQCSSDDSAKRQRDKRARDYANRLQEMSRDMSRDTSRDASRDGSVTGSSRARELEKDREKDCLPASLPASPQSPRASRRKTPDELEAERQRQRAALDARFPRKTKDRNGQDTAP